MVNEDLTRHSDFASQIIAKNLVCGCEWTEGNEVVSSIVR